MRTLLSATLLLAGAVACSSSQSGPTAYDSGPPTDGGGGGGRDVLNPNFDAPVVGPFDAFALDDAGASSTCAALTTYNTCNGTNDPCAAVDAKDCILWDGLYNLAGRQAITNCYGTACGVEAGTAIGCVYGAAISATPDSAANSLASHFCSACGGDAGACVAQFFSTFSGDGGIVGLGVLLELSLFSDSVISQIDKSCVPMAMAAGEGSCGDVFSECAGAIENPQPSDCAGTPPPGDAGGDSSDPGGA
jgi:hypothetical protein